MHIKFLRIEKMIGKSPKIWKEFHQRKFSPPLSALLDADTLPYPHGRSLFPIAFIITCFSLLFRLLILDIWGSSESHVWVNTARLWDIFNMRHQHKEGRRALQPQPSISTLSPPRAPLPQRKRGARVTGRFAAAARHTTLVLSPFLWNDHWLASLWGGSPGPRRSTFRPIWMFSKKILQPSPCR